jgi:hypothetical protein
VHAEATTDEEVAMLKARHSWYVWTSPVRNLDWVAERFSHR